MRTGFKRHRFIAALRGGVATGLLSLLAACASHAPLAQNPQPIPSQEPEAESYLAHARTRYQPPGPPGDPWGPYVAEASRRFDVPPTWIHEVMQVESAGYQFRATGELTTSPVGAMGLMQLMPDTYDEMRGRYHLGLDAYEPHDNILAGAAYLREMYDSFGAPAFLAAYNAGPARLQDYLVHNKPLPNETRRYVFMIGSRIQGVFPQTLSPAQDVAANQIPLEIPAGPRWVVHHSQVRLAARARRRHDGDLRYAALHKHGHVRQAQPVEVAEAPEPRQTHIASAAPVHAALHKGGGLHLISPALAADHVVLGGSHWAVQVGAYASRQQATHAASSARGLISRASAEVGPTHKGHATVYHARFGGLTHDGAVAACHRLSHCLVVSPASR